VPVRTLPLALVLLLVLLPQGAAAATGSRIIVKRDAGLSAAERADIRADADVRLVRSLSLPRTEVVVAAPGDTRDALRDLNRDRDVVYAELDHRRRAFAPDQFMRYLWAFENEGQFIHGPLSDGTPALPGGTVDADSDVLEAWGLLTDPGNGQTVAVVDSGIDAAHEDLLGRVGDQVNFIDEDPPGAADGNGHGTHVSGTIAATRDNGAGIAGVAPNATIMALRALDDDGGGYDSDIAEAFAHAGGEAVRVVNASLGGPGGGATLRAAIADYPNTLFVVAAGNGGADDVGDSNDVSPQYPCNVPEPNVLCVGASTYDDARGSFSNYGAFTVDVFAPGEGILSTFPGPSTPPNNDNYAWADGTSMASPLVAGAAALVLQADPSLSAVDVKEILLSSVDAKDAFSGRSVSGGRLNVEHAVGLAQNGTVLVDDDGDGFANFADACRMTAASGSADGCPDADEDAVPDHLDNCPTAYNPNQRNSDGRADGGDACDSDFDNDGVADGVDGCPATPAGTANGCPAPAPAPAPSPNADGDGFLDASDACPYEGAFTLNGCPVPALTALSGKVRKRGSLRYVVLRASTTRAATVRMLVQRKAGRRWVKVKKRTLATSGNRIKLTVSRLKRGRHRVVVAVYSSAGKGTSATRYFTVR
jgi:Subtilase family/Thrombospondin type 3 repeat